jgi:multidrug resistance efflux pump
MAVVPVNNVAASQARQPIAGRPALRPTALQGPRLGADATRLKPRATSSILPQAPAKFTGPEDFRAYMELLVAATQSLRAQAAGPKATLDAAEAAVKQKDADIGTMLQLAQMGYTGTRGSTAKETAELDAAIDVARQKLDAARHPGRPVAVKLRKEIDELHKQLAVAKQTLEKAQGDIDCGAVQGPALASAYAAIAMNKHTLKATEAKLATKGQELNDAMARTAPDYDPHVSDAKSRLADLEQRRENAGSDSATRLSQMKGRLESAQQDYDQQLTPLRADVEAAKAAYAPTKAALDAARQRIATADVSVTKTQRALWWARGFNLGQYMAEQARVVGQD